MHSLWYGARYAVLLLTDTLLYSWHGQRPDSWVRTLIHHRFTAPMHACASHPSAQDLSAWRAAQARYPDRIVYLALGSKSSPWYGTYFFHQVKVLVGSADGSPPSSPGDGYGMELARFRQSASQRASEPVKPDCSKPCYGLPALASLKKQWQQLIFS